MGVIHYGADIPLAIRLGSTIAVETDGDSVAVDPAAMASMPGTPRDVGRGSRQAPDQGMDDKALDMRVLSRIGKWSPQDATVESFERVSALGVPAENWTIQVSCATAPAPPSEIDLVPAYVRWSRRPGRRRTGRHRPEGPRPRAGELAGARRAGSQVAGGALAAIRPGAASRKRGSARDPRRGGHPRRSDGRGPLRPHPLRGVEWEPGSEFSRALSPTSRAAFVQGRVAPAARGRPRDDCRVLPPAAESARRGRVGAAHAQRLAGRCRVRRGVRGRPEGAQEALARST